MTDKENRIKNAELEVREAEINLRDAKLAMDEGFKAMTAKLNVRYSELKAEWEMSQINLERQRNYLELAKADAERGFEAT